MHSKAPAWAVAVFLEKVDPATASQVRWALPCKELSDRYGSREVS